MQGHFTVFDIENRGAELLCARENVVRHDVAAEKRLAVVGCGGLRVRPVIVFLRRGNRALDGRKVAVIRAGSGSEALPVGIVQKHQLGALGGREDLDAAAAVEVALGQVVLHVQLALLLVKVGRKVNEQTHLVDGVGGIGIGREDIRQSLRADLALGGVQHVGFEVVDAALTGRDDLDVPLLADSVVEVLDEPVERSKLVAVVVRPDGQLDRTCERRSFLRAARGRAEKQCADQQRRRDFHPFLHTVVPLSA